ncbi:MAG: zinc metallopeptidase [Bacillati bacterium ANGP1]|uniref:Zinc metallopeptidase n=1 Tax=Candidatus Segetimicrobium genomatis TaxID=2569760 RepID=A0A537LER3_9BACT|nr:MAG: zinc metallopeptidase [Terrabacteria group bacterium ANGP1]
MPFLFYDPTFIILIPGFLLALFAQWKVQSTFNHYSGIRAGNGFTGAQVAAELLRRQGITDVTIEQVGGRLADNYDPRTKKLRLSPDVYGSDSLAAVGVAAHETGHALQHRDGYAPLALRSAIVPAATLGTNAAWILFVLGIVTGLTRLMDVGIVLFLGYVVFSLITLPVELNASNRAVVALQGQGLVAPQEAAGVRSVLNAAALTYVAAAAVSILNLLRLVLIRQSRRD